MQRTIIIAPLTLTLALAGCGEATTADAPLAAPAQETIEASTTPQAEAAVEASEPAKPEGPMGWALPMDPTSLAEADRAAIMRAAGYRLYGKKWGKDAESAARCDASISDSFQSPSGKSPIRDINGDSRPEAIVTSRGSYCHGNTGEAFTLLTYSDKGWQVLTEITGIPSFYPRKGIAWPDIEVGGPGSNCFMFMRWNGKEYVVGGESLSGKICTLSPAFAKSAPATKATKIAFPPIEPGYWAINMGCAQAIRESDPNGPPDGIAFAYFDQNSEYLGSLGIKRIEALGGNRYRLHGQASYGNGEPIRVPSITDIVVNSRTSFTATSKDSTGSFTTRYLHCPTATIPREIRGAML